MRYLVKAKLKPNKENDLVQAIETGSLGQGSIAGHEYLRDMCHARQLEHGFTCWVEICFCTVPLQEELPYWEEYFEITEIKNAHNRQRCKDLNGTEPWGCLDCDCTKRLELRMTIWGSSFIDTLQNSLIDNKKNKSGPLNLRVF